MTMTEKDGKFIAVTVPNRVSTLALTKAANEHAAKLGRNEIAGFWIKGRNTFDTKRGHRLVHCVEDSLLNRYKKRAAFAKRCVLIVGDEIHKRTNQRRTMLPYLIKHRDQIPAKIMSPHKSHEKVCRAVVLLALLELWGPL